MATALYLVWGLACATTGSSSSWPAVPPAHYQQMGPSLRSEVEVVKQGEGWWVHVPAAAGQEVIVDVITTRPADVFLMDEAGIEEYKGLMRSGGGSANTHHGRKYTQHYTLNFTRPAGASQWWVLVDNSRFPDDGARSSALAAHVRIFEPSKEQKLATAAAACDRGEGDGCARVGFAHETGQGAAKNPIKALAYYDKACRMSSPRGCFLHGFAYRDAIGVPRDDARAVELFSRACGMGWTTSCTLLGRCYLEGRGVARDEQTGLGYLQRACDADDGWGCLAMSDAVRAGNAVRAAELRGKACRLKIEEACGTAPRPAATGSRPAMPASTAPAAAHDGTWRGRTSQGHPLMLEVASGAVVKLSVAVNGASGSCKVETSCPETAPCARLDAPAPITGGTFSFTHVTGAGLALRGTFSSTSAASGELTFRIAASKDCQAIDGAATWTVTRQ